MKKSLLIVLIALTFSCDDIIEVDDISAKSVILLAPTNQAVLNITDLTFSWQVVEEAESYHIQIATPSFENALQIVKDSVDVSNSFTTTLEANDYEWRVRAENSGYQTNYTTQTFTIEE